MLTIAAMDPQTRCDFAGYLNDRIASLEVQPPTLADLASATA